MIKFILGFAGSGKSTELAKRADDHTLVMTPTHKAADVLGAKGIRAVTIHSVLKLVPTINKNFRKGQRIDSIHQVGDTDLSMISDIFIDEFSMINKETFDLLLEVIPEHCNVTVFGDPYQLPPPTGKAIKPKKYSKDILYLNNQYRSEAPEVVDAFMQFVFYIKNGCKGKPPKVDLPKGDLSNFDPANSRALAYTNNKVIEMNNEIDYPTSEILINGVEADVYIENLGNYTFPKMMSKGKIRDDRESSDKILDDMSKYSMDMGDYKQISVKVGKLIYRCFVDYDHNNRLKKYKKDVERYQNLVVTQNGLDDKVNLTEWCRNNRSGKYVKERGKAWSNYMKHKDLVFDVRSRFASTVHKSQGSEYEQVFLALKDLKKCPDKEMYARLVYVGLSRAIKKVVIV